MSNVTNVIILCSLNNEGLAPRINEHFKLSPGLGWVSAVGDKNDAPCVGGGKALEQIVGIGAFDYLDLAGLVEHLQGLPWPEPENVQLLVCGQNEDRWRFVVDGVKRRG